MTLSTMGKVTMADIAGRAGVSSMTVSRAFRGDRKCGAATRARILQIAEEMGYEPDPLQSLHMSRVRTQKRREESGVVIGLLDMNEGRAAVEHNPSHQRFLRGTEARARELGLHVEVFNPVRDKISLARLRQILDARGIHGIIVLGLPRARSRLEINFDGIAAVSMAYSLDSPRLHRVAHNHYQSTWDVMETLAQRGVRRVGLAIEQSIQERVGQRWHAAYYEYCRFHDGMEVTPSIQFEWDASDWASRKALFPLIVEWAKRHRLEAIFGLDPWIMEALASSTDPCVRRVQYIDMDLYPGKTHLRCAGVDQRFEDLAAAAVDEIFGQWSRSQYGVPARAKNILLDGVFIEPDSSNRI